MTRQAVRILYDGDCGFCTASVRWAERTARPAAMLVPWQGESTTLTDPLREVLATAVVAVRGDLVVATGGRAVIELLRTSSRAPVRWVAAVLALPVLRGMVDLAYRVVARNRYRLPGSTDSCRVSDDGAFRPHAVQHRPFQHRPFQHRPFRHRRGA
jgi:predicted DCC family thiol-disulfide oxidoreductase YuxK